MIKTIFTTILIFGFYHCVAQADSALPITVHIQIDTQYVSTKEKTGYRTAVKQYGYKTSSVTVKERYYDITIEIRDTSDKPVKIWMMTCDWWRNFLLNNNYLELKKHECFSNYPMLVEIKPGESKIYKPTLIKPIKFDYGNGRQVEATRLGLIIIDNMFKPNAGIDYDVYMADKSKWRIIWSNALYLLEKEKEKAAIHTDF